MESFKNIFYTIFIVILTSFFTLFGNDMFDYFFPKNLLEYKFIDNKINNIEFYSIEIYNNGKQNQENIKIYLPIEKNETVFINKEIKINLNEEKSKNTYYIEIDEKKYIDLEKFEKNYVLKINSLKSNESINIKIINFDAYNISDYLNIQSNNIKVESNSIIGKLKEEDKIIKKIHKYSFYILCFILFSIMLWSIFFEFFATKEYKKSFYKKMIKDNEVNINKLEDK